MRTLLELVLCAQDLTCWAQALLLDGELAVAEPKTLRYRLLHVAARVVRHARRTILRLQRTWPWTAELARAFTGCEPCHCAANATATRADHCPPRPGQAAMPTSRPRVPPGTARQRQHHRPVSPPTSNAAGMPPKAPTRPPPPPREKPRLGGCVRAGGGGGGRPDAEVDGGGDRMGQASSTRMVKVAAKWSPGATRGVVPAARAAVGPVIGSRQTNSASGGANTWAWS
jgi:hypothetical protein